MVALGRSCMMTAVLGPLLWVVVSTRRKTVCFVFTSEVLFCARLIISIVLGGGVGVLGWRVPHPDRLVACSWLSVVCVVFATVVVLVEVVRALSCDGCVGLKRSFRGLTSRLIGFSWFMGDWLWLGRTECRNVLLIAISVVFWCVVSVWLC